MHTPPANREPELLDERSARDFRTAFGELLTSSSFVDTAILRIRLGAVDLSPRELRRLRGFRVLVADVNARTVEEEAYAMAVDPGKRENLDRILSLLKTGVMEIRSAPLGGWSPDFTVFSGGSGPFGLLIGLHWFHRPFPRRGPAFASRFGPEEALLAHRRFQELWPVAHDIGDAVGGLMERTATRGIRGGR